MACFVALAKARVAISVRSSGWLNISPSSVIGRYSVTRRVRRRSWLRPALALPLGPQPVEQGAAFGRHLGDDVRAVLLDNLDLAAVKLPHRLGIGRAVVPFQ